MTLVGLETKTFESQIMLLTRSPMRYPLRHRARLFLRPQWTGSDILLPLCSFHIYSGQVLIELQTVLLWDDLNPQSLYYITQRSLEVQCAIHCDTEPGTF